MATTAQSSPASASARRSSGVLAVAADRAWRPDLDAAPQRRRRTPLPHPRHAGRRGLDQRADQHEQGQRRGQSEHSCTRARSASSTPTSTRPSSRTASWCRRCKRKPPARSTRWRWSRSTTRSPVRTARRHPSSSPSCRRAASRTDTVMVVATSISQNAGADKPQTVRWTLRLDVSDVDGKLLISRLEPIR